MTATEIRLKQWLSDPANIFVRDQWPVSRNGFSEMLIRNRFVTSNGYGISIQQGASHYCNHGSVELWHCPHRPILDDYESVDEDGIRHPYGWVPLSIVAQYIDILEAEE